MELTWIQKLARNFLTTGQSSHEADGDPDHSISKGNLEGMTDPGNPNPESRPPAPAVECLPNELLIDIVQLYAGPVSPIRDLINLILVCQRWRVIVEGTPSFWCLITGNETRTHLRRGLQMSKQLPLNIKYDTEASLIGAETFFEEIGPHIGRWKSLVAVLPIVDFPLAELETKPAPVLEKLHLVSIYKHTWKAPVTLFGGAPAAPTLTDVRIKNLPIALQPLRLVKTRRLKLEAHPSATTTEIMGVLRASSNMDGFGLSDIQDQNDLTLVEDVIRLPVLKYLGMYAISQHMAQQILSNIYAPNLQKLWLTLFPTENPRTTIFPVLTSLIPAMKSITSNALAIDLKFNGLLYGIRIGELILSFQYGANNSDSGELAEDLLDWLVSQLGDSLMGLPISLSFRNCSTSPLYADWLSSRVRVTRLRLGHGLSGMTPRHSFDDVLPSLSKPNGSSSTGWLLPHVDILKIYLTSEGDNRDLVNMINARQSAANHEAPLEDRTPIVSPKRFREIHLSYGRNQFSGNQTPDANFMRAVQNAAGDADIYWSGVKWEG